MKDKNFARTALANDLTYLDYQYRIRKIATSRFVWNNLPKSWDVNFLEQSLYDDGYLCVLNHPHYNTLLVKASLEGYNLYQNPTRATPHTFNDTKLDDALTKTRYVYNGYLDDIDAGKEKIVLIKNNRTNTPTRYFVDLFCQRLFIVERTIDVNLNLQKTPLVLVCGDKQRLTLKDLYMKYDGNEPFIFADKSLFQENPIRTINTEAPYLIDKLTAHKQQIWNEVLTFLGVNNVNYEKKERLITDEANANNTLIQLNLEEELQARKLSALHLNNYFGLNISVSVNPLLSKNVEKKGEDVENE